MNTSNPLLKCDCENINHHPKSDTCYKCGLPVHPTTEPKCTCASFFTVRGVHKKDCPAYTPPVEGEWAEALQVEVMEDYLMDASRGAYYDASPEHKEKMRGHFEELKRFITNLLHSERAKYEECVQCTGLREEFRKEVVKMCEEMVKPIHNPHLSYEEEDFIHNQALSSLRDKLSNK